MPITEIPSPIAGGRPDVMSEPDCRLPFVMPDSRSARSWHEIERVADGTFIIIGRVMHHALPLTEIWCTCDCLDAAGQHIVTAQVHMR